MPKALIMHKKRDGTVTVEGTAPDDLMISTRLIGVGASEGHITTEVTYQFDGAPVTYEVVDVVLGDPENENSPVTAYKLRRKDAARPKAAKARPKTAAKEGEG